MKCNAWVKSKEGKKGVLTPCPHDRWMCLHFALRGGKPVDECKYEEYYNWDR